MLPVTEKPWRALFAGIGGGGIVTSGAILAMAAHLEGQRGPHARLHRAGAEERHRRRPCADRRRARRRSTSCASRSALRTSCSPRIWRCRPGPGVLERNAASAAVIGNLDLAATAAFKHDAESVDRCRAASPHHRAHHRRRSVQVYLHAVRLAEHLFGNAQAMNTHAARRCLAARPGAGRAKPPSCAPSN